MFDKVIDRFFFGQQRAETEAMEMKLFSILDIIINC